MLRPYDNRDFFIVRFSNSTELKIKNSYPISNAKYNRLKNRTDNNK